MLQASSTLGVRSQGQHSAPERPPRWAASQTTELTGAGNFGGLFGKREPDLARPLSWSPGLSPALHTRGPEIRKQW